MITESGPQHLGVVVAGVGFGGLAGAHALSGRGEDFAGDYLRRVAREHGLLSRIRFAAACSRRPGTTPRSAGELRPAPGR